MYEGSQIENNIDTPLQMQLAGLAKVISKAGYAIAAITFIALLTKVLPVLIRDAGHGLDLAHPEYLYGSRHVNRRFRTGRLADERDTQPCTQHEPHAENKQSSP